MFRYLLIRWGHISRVLSRLSENIFRLASNVLPYSGVLLFACHPGGTKDFEMDFKFLKNLITPLPILESYAQRSHI